MGRYITHQVTYGSETRNPEVTEHLRNVITKSGKLRDTQTVIAKIGVVREIYLPQKHNSGVTLPWDRIRTVDSQPTNATARLSGLTYLYVNWQFADNLAISTTCGLDFCCSAWDVHF